jgi:F420-dependent oxidoreductase-like protein
LGDVVKLTTLVPYAADFHSTARTVVAMEKAGLDSVLVPEAYSFDAISQIGYLAAVTERLEIGTGLINVFSRSAALLGMTAAGCDYVSGGRFFLGLGASGPQVVEGFHGVAYDHPLARTREVIEVVRAVLRREVIEHHGPTIDIPVPAAKGTGLGRPMKLINHPVRSEVPIWWASLKAGAVRATAEIADGWLPMLYVPERAERVWGDELRRGAMARSTDLASLEIAAGGPVAIGDGLDVQALRDLSRPFVALYVGGMGARGKNFYNDIAVAYGFGEEARTIQELYLDGKKKEAEAAVPEALLEGLTLIGPRGYVADRLAAFRAAGVTRLNVEPIGDPVETITSLRDLL